MKTIIVIDEKQELTPEQMQYVLDNIHNDKDTKVIICGDKK